MRPAICLSVCVGVQTRFTTKTSQLFSRSAVNGEKPPSVCWSQVVFFPSFSPSCSSFTAGQTCTLHIARLSIFRRKKIFGTGSSDTQTCSLVMRVLSSLSSCFLESPPVSPDLSVTQIRHSLDLSIVYK